MTFTDFTNNIHSNWMNILSNKLYEKLWYIKFHQQFQETINFCDTSAIRGFHPPCPSCIHFSISASKSTRTLSPTLNWQGMSPWATMSGNSPEQTKWNHCHCTSRKPQQQILQWNQFHQHNCHFSNCEFVRHKVVNTDFQFKLDLY